MRYTAASLSKKKKLTHKQTTTTKNTWEREGEYTVYSMSTVIPIYNLQVFIS